MFAQNELEAVQISIDKAKKAVDLMNALDKLQKNRNFDLLINKGYLEEEALRLVYLKSDFQMSSPEQQDFITKGIEGIGQLRNFLSMVYRQGESAKAALADHENTREQILAEELEGDN